MCSPLIAAAVWMPEANASSEKQAVPAVFLMKTIEGDEISIPNKGQKTILHFGHRGVRRAKRTAAVPNVL